MTVNSSDKTVLLRCPKCSKSTLRYCNDLTLDQSLTCATCGSSSPARKFKTACYVPQ